MLVTPNSVDSVANIKVVGVGGGGGNTVNTMISDYNIDGVEFYAFNTDAQALKNSLAPVTLQMGQELTRGLGVGGNHSVGAKAAEESLDEIHEHLAGADMVFITAGMGGGTGTGAAPVIAGVAKNLGALTVAVVTKPFMFEGRHRERIADEGLEELKDKVDTLIVVPNQRLMDIIDDSISFLEAMKKVDGVLSQGVKSISSLVTKSGFINVDFADVKAIMTDAGTSLMGMGTASGDNRAESAARQATNSPLLDMSIEGATGILFNITGGQDMSMTEINTAAQMVQEAVDEDARIIFGATIDEEMKDEVQITIVATGFDQEKQNKAMSTAREPESTPPSLIKQGNQQQSQTESFLKDEHVPTQTKPENSHTNSNNTNSSSGDNVVQSDDELDIPAFMRRG